MEILVAGATGYIGGRLVPQLVEAGHDVRCLTRRPEKLAGVAWADAVEVVQGDALDADSLPGAMDGIEAVYYLVHSIGTGHDFEDTDRRAATNVAEAAKAAGVGRIVYLGGLIPAEDEEASPHLASRAEVGQIFLDSGVPAVVLQAGVVIGSGSASFEMLRYLTERLPVMITPTWVESRVQPIAVRDVLTYLAGSLTLPEGTNRRFDVGGPDVLTYREMMQRYAAAAGLKRRVIFPVRVLSPWLSSQWVNLVTPVPKAIAQPLIESLRNSVVVGEDDITERIPTELLGFDEAVHLALDQVRTGDVVTRWSGADWPGAPSDPLPTDPDWSGGTVYRDERSTPVDATVDQLWAAIEGIGGDTAGTRSPWPGPCGASWTAWPAAWACAAAAGTRTAPRWASPSTSGGWRPSSGAGSCASGPRCGSPAAVADLLHRRGRGRPPRPAPAGPLHPPGTGGHPLLVVGLALPRDRLRLDAPQPGQGGRGAGRRARRGRGPTRGLIRTRAGRERRCGPAAR